jgi:hypothetical protein
MEGKRESLFVWHLAQNLSSVGGPTSRHGAAGIAFKPKSLQMTINSEKKKSIECSESDF